MRRGRFGHPLRKLHFNPSSGRRIDPIADPIEAVGDAVPEIDMMDHVLLNEIKTQGSKVRNDLLPRPAIYAPTFNKGRGQEISATVPCLAAALGLPLNIHATSVVQTVFVGSIFVYTTEFGAMTQ